MAGDLKSFFGQRVVESLAQDFSRADPRFDSAGFIAESMRGIESLELLARGWHIAEALKRRLPEEFPRAARIILRSLGPELNMTESAGMEVFRYLPHVFYVAKYGVDFFDDAMRVQYELTKRFSAEFSIRTYLIKYPDETYRRLREWAKDPNVHVRRLVSEGTRPRLPWAMRLPAFQQDPSPVVALLELLKDDPELYVRRSVANSLNDIAKDHPEITVEACRRWIKGATPERRWVVRHALRSLVKKGNPAALKLLGVGAAAQVRLQAVRFSSRSVRVGGELEFSFVLTSITGSTQSLLVDYVVHFAKAKGRTSRKVFKLKRVDLPPRASVKLSGRVTFKEMTTRKHYPGRHRFEAMINGKVFPLGTVMLSE